MNDERADRIHPETLRIVRGLQWTYLSVALQGILKVAVLAILARMLTPRDFGLLSFALICTSFIERIGQLGIGPALVQAQTVTPDSIKTAHLMSIALGGFSALTVALGANTCSKFFEEPLLTSILLILSAGCIFEATASIEEALLQRQMRFKEIMIADNLAYVISMAGCGVTLAICGLGVWSLVWATILLKVVRMVALRSFRESISRGQASLLEATRLLRVGLGFSLARVLNFFSLQGDNFIVGRILGVEALGVYGRAYQLMTLPAMYVGQVFEKVMFPVMAKNQASHERLAREFLLTLEAITLVALPTGVVVYALASEIVLVIFGEPWRGAIPVVSIVSFGIFFRTAYKCSDTVVRSVGAVYHYAARQALYTVLVLGGALFGSLTSGLPGVAIGVVAAVAINYFSMTILCAKTIQLSPKRIVAAHISGVWVSGVVLTGLLFVMPSLRESTDHAGVVLLFGGGVSTSLWLVGVLTAYQLFPAGILAKVGRLMQVLRFREGLGSRSGMS